MTLNRRHRLIVLWAVSALLIASAVIASQWQFPVQAQAQDADKTGDKRTITVTGYGEITAEPDVAYINLGVMTAGKTADEAQSANAAVFEKLRKVLYDQYKIGEKDVKSVGLYVYPEYSYKDGQELKITGYKASHSIRITYRELDRIGELLDATVKAGANQVNNVQFATEKSEGYELESLKLAMENARKKAEVLAAAEGRTLKGAIEIVSNGGGGGIYFGKTVSYAENAADSLAVTSVNPGEIVIRANVTVVYEF